jgi:ribosomal protein L24
MKVGDKVKIVKGTHKHKWGHIFLLKEHFVQVKVQDYIKSKAKGDSEDVIVEKVVRAKREFVIEVPEVVIEMPNADQVQPVIDLPADFDLPKMMSDADQALCQKILDQMPQPENDDDILSQYDEEEEPVDIAVVLPTTNETFALKKMCDSQGSHIDELENQLVKMGMERTELYEACEMFIKCADFVKGRLEALDPAVE